MDCEQSTSTLRELQAHRNQRNGFAKDIGHEDTNAQSNVEYYNDERSLRE
jgi:hypothetical protein